MRILEANKVTLVGATCKKALDALMKSSDMLHIIVCDSDINSAQSTLVGNQQVVNFFPHNSHAPYVFLTGI